MTTDLSDQNKEPELYKLVRKNQLHRHTFTCRKGNNNRFKFKRRVKDILSNEESVLAEVDNEQKIEGEECDETFDEHQNKSTFYSLLSSADEILSSANLKFTSKSIPTKL